MKNNSLIILRGLPSSGKTSFAKLFETKAICSADDYHYRNGVYNWDSEKAEIAHAWAVRKCERFMKLNYPKVVVANTNITQTEMQPYTDLGNKFGYRIYYIIVEKRHNYKNSHGVPEEIVEKMRTSFEIEI